MVSHGRRAGTCQGTVTIWVYMYYETAKAAFPRITYRPMPGYNIGAAQGNGGEEQVENLLEIIAEKMPTAGITKAQELSLEYWEAYGPNRTSSE